MLLSAYLVRAARHFGGRRYGQGCRQTPAGVGGRRLAHTSSLRDRDRGAGRSTGARSACLRCRRGDRAHLRHDAWLFNDRRCPRQMGDAERRRSAGRDHEPARDRAHGARGNRRDCLSKLQPGHDLRSTITRVDSSTFVVPLSMRVDAAVEAEWYRNVRVLNSCCCSCSGAAQGTSGRARRSGVT